MTPAAKIAHATWDACPKCRWFHPDEGCIWGAAPDLALDRADWIICTQYQDKGEIDEPAPTAT